MTSPRTPTPAPTSAPAAEPAPPPTSPALRRCRDDTRTRLVALRTAAARPGPERDAVMLLVKAAVATVLAWQFATRVLHSPVPFYAPMAALLVVDRTLVRSLSASVQRIAAVVLGLSVAWVVATYVGVTWWTVAPVLLVALVIGRWSRLGDHGIQVPTMVLLALITAKGTDEQFTALTIVETVAGGVIGVAVNAVVLAPLHLTQPRQRVRALTRQAAELLEAMAEGLAGDWDEELAGRWHRSADEIAERAPLVLDDVRTGRESTRFNPRDNLRPADVDWDGYERTVTAVRCTVWHVTGIGRTLVDAAREAHRRPAPSPDFLARYAEALGSMALAVHQLGRHDDDSRRAFRDAVADALEVLGELGEQVRATPFDDTEQWTVYGALLSDSVRAVHELELAGESAVVPTDTAPVRLPPTSSALWGRVRRLRWSRRSAGTQDRGPG
ncbi:aromatic acid exporter family protein [Terrabacter sp. NPDC000476]|uniref:FUSC family protein n=1 Tax=Terrabacter sp. NPDC000476 TaxID=3154258 RepID=UPI003321BFA5